MVVCRYFLQGYCKFGEHCRYQHYQDNRGSNQIAAYRGHSRSWHAPNHGQPARASSPVATYHTPQVRPGSINPLDLAEAIKEDVIAMEEGGQWPLSCYTPSKDFGSFPGFHDTSMEEVRYEAYQALASGTFDQYVKKVENLIQATRMKWGMLKNPTGQVMSVIEKMASGQGGAGGESPSAGLCTFSFAASFHSSAQQQPQQQASVFSLGGNTAFTAPQSPGGGSMFPLGTSPSSAAASNFKFTLTPQPASDSPFGTTVHGSPPTGFGSALPAFNQSGGMLFGGSTSLGSVQQQQQPMSTGFFGAAPVAEKQSFAFGVNPTQTTASVFGSHATDSGASAFQPKAVANQLQHANPGIYTTLMDLSEAERKEFTAVTFTLGCVPLRPPPSELCV